MARLPLTRGQQIPSLKALMNIKPADRPQLCAQAQNTPGVCFRFQEKTLRRRSMFQTTRMRRLWQCHKAMTTVNVCAPERCQPPLLNPGFRFLSQLILFS